MGKASHKKLKNLRVAPPPGTQPMSAALIDLVEPLRNDDLSLKAYQVLIMIGSLAWNLSLFPKSERKAQMQAFFNIEKNYHLSFNEIIALASDEEVTEEPNEGMNLVQTLKALIHRKERLFPDDRRYVAKAEVDWKNDNFHVTAGYQLFQPSDESAEA